MAIRKTNTYGEVEVTVMQAKKQLSKLIQAVETGELVMISRDGRPVAQMVPPSLPTKRLVQFGGMAGKIKFHPGWDDPVSLDAFLNGDLWAVRPFLTFELPGQIVGRHCSSVQNGIFRWES